MPDKPAEQVQALCSSLIGAPAPLTSTQVARNFNRAQTRKVEELLDTLVTLGQGQVQRGGWAVQFRGMMHESAGTRFALIPAYRPWADCLPGTRFALIPAYLALGDAFSGIRA